MPDSPVAVQIAAFAMLLSVAFVLIRALVGPTVYDRILAVNMMGTKTVLLLALIGTVTRRSGFLDIALLYALINYVMTIAVLKFVQFRRLS